MKHVLAYIKETKCYSIRYYSGAELKPIGYVDTDFADSSITWQLTNGYIFLMNILTWLEKYNNLSGYRISLTNLTWSKRGQNTSGVH